MTSFTHFLSKHRWLVLVLTILVCYPLQGSSAQPDLRRGSRSVTINQPNGTIGSVLRAIEAQTGLRFFYNNQELDADKQCHLQVSNEPIELVMKAILQDEFTYTVENGMVIIVPKAQKQAPVSRYTVTGRVVDHQGNPILSAVVVVKGHDSLGATTDIDGRFSIPNVPIDALLKVSYVGMIPQEIALNGKQDLNIVLLEDAKILDEVVVTGFGLAQKKESLTSAISVIGADDLSRSIAPTASGALVGKIAGINSRQTDGRPGSSTDIQIRNMGTPLFVIDGIQSDAGHFNNIDFNDIESISVLKDASAAIYGVRAANGVIVVTTKKGRRETPNTISINAYYGWQNLYSFPRPASAETYIRNYTQSQTIQQGKDAPYRYTREDYAKWQAGTEKGYQPFDWYDYIFETSPQSYVSASATGGSERINYYVSLSNLNQHAIIVNYGGFNRTNALMNINATLAQNFKIGAGVNARLESRVNPGVPEADDYWLPRLATYRNLPTKRPYANDNPKYPTMTSTLPGSNFAWLNYDLSGRFEETWRVIQMNLNAEYEITQGLKAKALLSYYFANQILNNQEYTYKLYGYDEATDTYPVIFENKNPWRERRQAYTEDLTSNIQLAYDNKFGAHNISAVLGMEAIKRSTPNNWIHSVPVSNALHLIDFETIAEYNDVGKDTQARLGFLGRVNYDYAGKYLLELSGRYDGSWKFPPSSRWGFFPSISGGWRISEEDFFADSPAGKYVSDLKVRASYGMLGDDNTPGYGPFDYMQGYNYKVGGAVLDGELVIGSEPRGLPVTTLSWLRSRLFDVGIDYGFFDGRLSGTIDYFERLRTGIPERRYDVLIPSEMGFALPMENLRSDRFRGMDFLISWSDHVGDFNYNIAGNLTYSRFYDWDQYKPRFGNSWHEYRNSISHRFGYLNWGLQSDGQFESWEEIANWPIDNDREGNKTLRPGDIKYKDLNNDKVINWMDERPIGYREDSTPILNWGLNFSMNWKGIDLAMDLTGGALSTWFQDWEQRSPFLSGGNNPQYYMENTWHLADIWDPASELIPGKYPTLLLGNGAHSNYWNSDFWKTNVSYVKVRNLVLGYSLPRELIERAKLSKVRLYVSGQNLFGFSNLEGVDPEIRDSNGLGYPTMRIINVGLNIDF